MAASYPGLLAVTPSLGTQPVEVDWHYWGLKCPDSEEWRLWEEFNQVMGDSPTRARQAATPLGRNSSSSTSTVSCLAGRGPASA